MKQCPKCSEPKPESEFYRNCKHPDGLTTLCKDHQKEAVRTSYRAGAELRRAQRALRKRTRPVKVRVKRKPSVIARVRSMSVKDKVIWAMERGARTRESIQAVAGIRDEDRMSDALADLYDTNQLDRRSLKARVYRLCG